MVELLIVSLLYKQAFVPHSVVCGSQVQEDNSCFVTSLIAI